MMSFSRTGLKRSGAGCSCAIVRAMLCRLLGSNDGEVVHEVVYPTPTLSTETYLAGTLPVLDI